jgi:DNA-binding MarR family transcriptional regulator
MQHLLSKNLRRLSRLYNKTISKELPNFDSEYYAEILLIVSSNQQPTAQKTLVEHLHLDKSRVAILIDHLNKDQYTYTERNPADRREHFIYLTDKGKRLMPIIQQAIDKVNTSINKHLSEQNLNCFYATLLQMEQNLTE